MHLQRSVYSAALVRGCLTTQHSWCFSEMKRSLSLPFYVIAEMIGILMGYAGQSAGSREDELQPS